MGGTGVSPCTLSVWLLKLSSRPARLGDFTAIDIRQNKTITLQKIENIFSFTKVDAAQLFTYHFFYTILIIKEYVIGNCYRRRILKKIIPILIITTVVTIDIVAGVIIGQFERLPALPDIFGWDDTFEASVITIM